MDNSCAVEEAKGRSIIAFIILVINVSFKKIQLFIIHKIFDCDRFCTP